MSPSPTDSPMLLGPGSRLDRYELLSLLGQGGMGAVWLARLMAHLEFKKVVAVKTLLPQFAGDPRFRGMFLDEARITSRLDHGNVVQTLELGEFGGWLYQAMEWVDGDSLRTLMMAMERDDERMPAAISLRIIADACAGTHSAHELRDRSTGELLDVVHRDISPHNVLVCTNGITKVADFGIAKAKGRTSPETTSGDVKGKIAYMAPEQALGEPIDRRADIWALGCILYELLSGHKVFESSNQIEMLQRLISSEPKITFAQEYPEEIVSIVRRALRPQREARFETAGDMERAIRIGSQHSGLLADVDDVARFYARYLGIQAKQRAMTIEMALEAAEQRQRVSIRGVMPPSTESRTAPAPRPRPVAVAHGPVVLSERAGPDDEPSTVSGSLLVDEELEDAPTIGSAEESDVGPAVDMSDGVVAIEGAPGPAEGLDDVPTERNFEPGAVSDDSKETLVTGMQLSPVFAASVIEARQPRGAFSVIMVVSAVLLVIVIALAGVVTRRSSSVGAANSALSSAGSVAPSAASVAQPVPNGTSTAEFDIVIDPQSPAAERPGSSTTGPAAAPKSSASKARWAQPPTSVGPASRSNCGKDDPDCLYYRPPSPPRKK
jgi:eukaryotic-like serine/threonine-protein kinase